MTGDPDVIRMAHRDAQSSPSTLSVRLAMQLRLLHDALQQRSNLLHALGNPDRVCNATQVAVERDMAPFCSALSGCPRGIPGCNSGSQSAECSGGTCRIFDGSPFSCEQLAEQAILQQKRLLDAADRSCASDADCAFFYEPPSCVFTCGLLARVVTSVSARSAPALQLAVRSLGSKYCNAWFWRPCREPTELSACPVPEGEPRAACVAGVCDVRYVTTP